MKMENQNEHDSTQDDKENDPNYENCTSCGKVVTGRESHFATCPNAHQHRKAS